jgi:hypothetical protein
MGKKTGVVSQFVCGAPGLSLQQNHAYTSPSAFRFTTMLCLSERNIENHRYRIRQKMELSREQNLHEVLHKF